MTPKPTPSPADRLRELHAKTTPGEWFVDPPDPKKPRRVRKFIECILIEGRFKGLKAVMAQAGAPADRDFIIAAHNDLPALLSDHARLVEENGRLREALTALASEEGFPYLTNSEKLEHRISFAQRALARKTEAADG